MYRDRVSTRRKAQWIDGLHDETIREFDDHDAVEWVRQVFDID